MTTQGTMPTFRGALSGEPTPDYDALAELFLASDSEIGGSSRHEPPRAAARGALVVEALMIGHLPVLGPAWIGQYARSVAAEIKAPVAVLHAGSGRVAIEVHGASTTPATPAPLDDAGEALAAGLALARHWILRADELDEPALWDMPGLDGVTLLAGADPMATVASYRTLKRCLLRPGVRESGPVVRVAIMGADPAEAAAAEASLRRAVEAFVDAPIEFRRSSGKIGTARSAIRLFESARGQDAATLIGLLRSIDSRPGAPVASAAPPLPEPRDQPAARKPASPDAAGEFAECATSPLPLASHVPGLEPLPARCPYAPEVELASTADGRLHLLTRVGPGLPSDPLSRLMSASAWADDHAELLRLAIPALSARAGERSLHLFVPAPPARPIVAHGLRVHLLAPVRVGDRTGWYRAELA